jgi:hypothetical protein
MRSAMVRSCRWTLQQLLHDNLDRPGDARCVVDDATGLGEWIYGHDREALAKREARLFVEPVPVDPLELGEGEIE